MKTITIGRGANNNVVLKPQDISTNHARITELGNGEYKVEDLDSANGVYVNGYRIKTSNVSSLDQIRLSASHIIDLDVLFGKKQGKILSSTANPISGNNPATSAKAKKDYTEEFAQLKTLYDTQINKLDKVDESEQRKQSLLRIGLMMIPISLSYIEGMRIFTGASIIFATIPQFLSKKGNVRKKKEKYNIDLIRRFVCPNKSCNQMLFGQSWTIWHERGECPKCKAVFNKNKL